MFIKTATLVIVIFLAMVISICLPIAILLIFNRDRMLNNLGLSGLGYFLFYSLLDYGLAIATSLEIVLVGVITFKGWIPAKLGAIAFLLLVAILVIAIISFKSLIKTSTSN